MVKQLQAQQQKVVINLAPPVKRRKKKRKKKSKAIDAVGDFRTALARSAFIQRGIGGLGFNQGGGGGQPFRPSLNANAVRLNARSNFEGVRRERPTLRTAMETQTDPNPVDTSTGSVRGAIHTPRLLNEARLIPSDEFSDTSSVSSVSSGISSITGSSRDASTDTVSTPSTTASAELMPPPPPRLPTPIRIPNPPMPIMSIEDLSTQSSSSDAGGLTEFDSESADGGESGVDTITTVATGVDDANDFNKETTKTKNIRRTNTEMIEAMDMGLADDRRNTSPYTQQGILADPSHRNRILARREKQREGINSLVEKGSTLGEGDLGGTSDLGKTITEPSYDEEEMVDSDADTDITEYEL